MAMNMHMLGFDFVNVVMDYMLTFFGHNNGQPLILNNFRSKESQAVQSLTDFSDFAGTEKTSE